MIGKKIEFQLSYLVKQGGKIQNIFFLIFLAPFHA